MDATFVIEREPTGNGGRRFAEKNASGGNEVFGKIYLSQAASRQLGNPTAITIFVEAADPAEAAA